MFAAQMSDADDQSGSIPDLLARHGLNGDTAPSVEEWGAFLATLARAGVPQSESSYEHLFEMSPVPTLEQDYTLLVTFMERLRGTGVTDIRAWLHDEPTRLFELVPLISIVRANPAAARVIGMTAHRVIGPIDPVIVNDGAQEAWIDQIDLIWSGGSSNTFEFEAATASGVPFEALRTMSVPQGSFGLDYSRVVMTLEDITERKQETRRMRETIKAKTQFLATISHEIRTPLTGILGFSEILVDDPTLAVSADGSEILRSIVDQARDVGHIVEDLLVSARGEIGELAVLDEEIDVCGEVDSVLSLRGDLAPAVAVTTKSATSILARGDSVRFRQVLRNLLSNAERYGGKDIRISVTRTGSLTQVVVSDDGEGVPEAMREAIFEPFTRVTENPTMTASVGIGLSICRALVDLMRGSLRYRYVDARSEFVLTLRATGVSVESA